MAWLQPIGKFSPDQTAAYDSVIAGINSDNNYTALIKGPAGTGKTLILAQIALKMRGKRGIFFIYTNALRNFINHALSQSGQEVTEIQAKVETFHTWLHRLYKQYIGVVPQNMPDYNEKANQMIDELINIVEADVFDYFLVDEGQDFSPKVIGFLNKVAKNLVFVGDANQSFYQEHEDDLSDLISLINPNEQFSVTLSVRISPSILRFMSEWVHNIYNDLTTVTRDDDRDSKPLFYHSIAFDRFLAYFIKNVAMNYLQSGKNLVITCVHNDTVDSIYAQIKTMMPDNNQDKIKRVTTTRDQVIDFSENAIYCITMHSVKGLEFDNLLFLNIDFTPVGSKREQNNLAYTSYTRATDDLIIYSQNQNIPLRQYLDFDYATIINELPDDSPADVDIEDLI